MVYIRRVKFAGLFSYPEETEIEFSRRSVLVGPNNSGKSNIIRILKLFIDTFSERKRLSESEMSHLDTNPYLEIKLTFSEEETNKIIDFLSFSPSGSNRASKYHDFKNRNSLLKILDDLSIKLTWQREVHGYGSEPYPEFNFEKIGLLASWSFSSSSFPISTKSRPLNSYHMRSDLYFCDILESLSNNVDKKEVLSMVDSKEGEFVTLDNVRYQNDVLLDNKGKRVMQDIYSYVGSDIQSSQEVSFVTFLGKILKHGFYHAAGRVSTYDVLDFVENLKTYNNEDDFDKRLNQSAIAFNLARTEELESDGSNLSQYLFHLMVSPNTKDKDKFEKIRHAFNEIMKVDELSFDVSLEYQKTQRQVTFGQKDPEIPKRPTILIADKKLGKRFPLQQVGAGLAEIIYLLTASYGMQDSVIMLDEPSVNLHPSMMKALMRYIEKPENKNQFITITHSAELTQYELFEGEAELFYVRKSNQISKIKSLKGEVNEWFETNRSRFKHQIDSRIFFGRCVILTEGESDRNLLGISHYLESSDTFIDLSSNDVIVTSVGGMKNFVKYRKLLDSFEIPYLILADSNARSLFDSYGTITKDGIKGENDVYVIDNGNLEDLMKDIDNDVYAKAENEFRGSKPTISFEFTREVLAKNSDALKPIMLLLEKTIKKAKE